MTRLERGDVVLVSFVYSDESGRKLRPAVVISAGLLFPPTCTASFRTIKRGMIDRKPGTMAASDLELLDRETRRSLGL